MDIIKQIVNDIKNEVSNGNKTIVASSYSHLFGKTVTSLAFKQAIKDGILIINYIGANNNKVYMGK